MNVPNTPVTVSTSTGLITNPEVQHSNSTPRSNSNVIRIVEVKKEEMKIKANTELIKAEADLKAAQKKAELASRLQKNN